MPVFCLFWLNSSHLQWPAPPLPPLPLTSLLHRSMSLAKATTLLAAATGSIESST